MASLGSFGAAVRESDPDAEKDTFEFFGETFTVHGVIPPMLDIQLGAAMSGKAGRMDANAAIYAVFRCALTIPEHEAGGQKVAADDAEFDRFFMLSVDKADDLDDLIQLAFTLIGAQAGKAAERLPTSASGSPRTGTNSSSSASDTPESPRLRPVDEVLAG